LPKRHALTESCLVGGDCGSWVIDRENGRLYGHIVAGHPGTGVGYIVPSSQLFQDIEQTTGNALVLPKVETALEQSQIPFEMKDYYSILGVGKNADASQIKMAYNTALFFINYGDSDPKDETLRERLKDIEEGYITLSDPE
jgi:hypothetical protein